MSDQPEVFAVGDRVTFECEGEIRDTFIVEEVEGGCLYGRGRGTMLRASRARRWRSGDDEAMQYRRDTQTCANFQRWSELTAADAAAIASILREYADE